MYYLIYISSSTVLMSNDELVNLLKESRLNNEKIGITGMLLYKDGSFMQYIEGEKDTVINLYKKIVKDTRHTDPIRLLENDIEERNFSDWSMGFMNMDKAENLPKYKDYIEENFNLKSFCDDSQDAYSFIKIFNNLVKH